MVKQRFYSRITFKIFIVLISALFVAFQVLSISSSYLLPALFPNVPADGGENAGKLYYIAGLILMFGLPLIAFSATIILLVGRRLKYFNYIINSMEKLNENEFLDSLEVKGKDEFAKLAENINCMSNRIKVRYEEERMIEASKNELISNIAHDLKSPLTSIIGYMELITQNKYKDEETRISYENKVYSKSIYLNHMVNSLFEYTKLIDTNIKLKKTICNISMLLIQTIGENIPKFEERNIDIQADNIASEVYAEVEPSQIIRVFDNIIENAYKYTDENTIFTVSLRVENEKINISFENETSLLTLDDLDKLFDKTYRADKSRSSNNEGSGLGLTICKRIIELHAGEITAQYENNKIKFLIQLGNIKELRDGSENE